MQTTRRDISLLPACSNVIGGEQLEAVYQLTSHNRTEWSVILGIQMIIKLHDHIVLLPLNYIHFE
jgi:hypothetical protein